jgi:hypothetical protein
VARQLMTLSARFADQPVTRSGGLLRRMKDAR